MPPLRRKIRPQRGTRASGVGTALDLDGFLPYRLNVLAHRMSRSLAGVYGARFGISIAEWRIVANLGQAGPLGAGVLAERSSLDKPKATRAIQRLEARGLVARRTDASDRRRATLALTAEGRRIYAAIVPEALAWESALLAALAPAERAALRSALDRIETRLAALD